MNTTSALKFQLFDKFRSMVFYIAVLHITISLFLMVYNPFNMMNRASEGMLITIIASLIVATIFSAIASLTIFLYRWKIRNNRFTIYDFIMMVIINIILSSIIFSAGSLSTIYDFFESILQTGGIVIIPYLLTISFCTIKYLVKELLDRKARLTQIRLEKEKFEVDMIRFVDEYGKTCFHLDKNTILYLESNDNYVNIYYFSNMRVSYKILRASMKSIEEMLDRYKIVRCHRSYMVNINKINHVEKDKGKMKLAMSEGDFLVPVSASFTPKLMKIIDILPLK